MNFDVLIVGAGFAGSVMARELAEAGKKILILERRNVISGNMYDYRCDSGIMVHKYGPHTFHTDDKRIYDYLQKFGEWDDYRLECSAIINGKITPSPFNFQTIDDFFPGEAGEIKRALLKEYYHAEKTTIIELLKSKNPLVKKFADFLFQNNYSLYTAKQWGMPASSIDVSILKRVPIRLSYKTGYFDDAYQCMPKKSYSTFFTNLISHNNISVELNTDATARIRIEKNGIYFNGLKIEIPVVYTGAIDELLGYRYGALPYRSLRFDWKTDHINSMQPTSVVQFPQEKEFTRITEYKKIPIQEIHGVTTYAVEYPIPFELGTDREPYYPILNEQNLAAYETYKKNIKSITNLYICGRLA